MINRKPIQYRIVRFCPDRQVGEYLNVGILATSEAFGKLGSRITNNDFRIGLTFGVEALGSWKILRQELIKYLKENHRLDKTAEYMDPILDRGLSLELSATQLVLGEKFETELDILAENYNLTGQEVDLGASGILQVFDETTLAATLDSIAKKKLSLERDQQRFLEEKGLLEDSFARLAKFALNQAQYQLIENAKEKLAKDPRVGQKEIDEVLKPMRDALTQLKEHTKDIDRKRTGSYAKMTMQVGTLLASTIKLGNALNRPEVRGSWGELTLRRAAEHAGLIEGTDFDMQIHAAIVDGQFRPDMIVRLANNRVIAVDSKVPLSAYLASLDTEDPIEKQFQLKQHAAQVRKHITQLSTKQYQGMYADTADFVVMFVPNEALYQVAIQEDPSLLEEAFSRKVILANPMTLVALLKTIANGMQQQKAYENALQIAKLDGELHYSVATFAERLTVRPPNAPRIKSVASALN